MPGRDDIFVYYCHAKASGQSRFNELGLLVRDLKEDYLDLTPALLAEKLTKENNASGNKILLLVHRTPFDHDAFGLEDLVASIPQGLTRLCLVLVSNGGVPDNDLMTKLLTQASILNIGGFTWWTGSLDQGDVNALAQAVEEVCLCWMTDNLPFGEFHKMFRRRPDVATEILDQLTKIVADDDTGLMRRLEAWRDLGRSDDALPIAVRQSLVSLTEQRRNWNQRRARLRHHDLSNQMLSALNAAINKAAGEVQDEVSDAVNAVIIKWECVRNDALALFPEFEKVMTPKRLRELGWKEISNEKLEENERQWKIRNQAIIDATGACIIQGNQAVGVLQQENCHSVAEPLHELREATRGLIDALGRFE